MAQRWGAQHPSCFAPIASHLTSKKNTIFLLEPETVEFLNYGKHSKLLCIPTPTQNELDIELASKAQSLTDYVYLFCFATCSLVKQSNCTVNEIFSFEKCIPGNNQI